MHRDDRSGSCRSLSPPFCEQDDYRGWACERRKAALGAVARALGRAPTLGKSSAYLGEADLSDIIGLVKEAYNTESLLRIGAITLDRRMAGYCITAPRRLSEAPLSEPPLTGGLLPRTYVYHRLSVRKQMASRRRSQRSCRHHRRRSRPDSLVVIGLFRARRNRAGRPKGRGQTDPSARGRMAALYFVDKLSYCRLKLSVWFYAGGQRRSGRHGHLDL